MIKRTLIGSLAVLLSLVFVTSSIARQHSHGGAVYAMTNDSDGNEIAMYNRNAKGLLELATYYPTEGFGSGDMIDPLGSQESLILSANKRWLLAVNAGSNTISVFRTRHNKLKLIGTVGSGGVFPVSLTLYHDLLYVLNAGADSFSPNITGFRLTHWGDLIPLADSTRELGPGGFHQVGFDPQGDVLVVTEGDPAGQNNIHVFSVDRNGLPSLEPVTSPSNGIVPFGFIFDRRGHLLVSEAGSRAVTSYKILPDNSLQVISPSVENEQIATCWITANSRGFVYTANTGSDTISAYKLQSGSGRLMLLDATAGSGDKPIDMTTTGNGRFLYVLNAGDGTVGMFRINPDGSLEDLGAIDGLPETFAQGIVGR
jgi:6-phosphogluconolactonase